MERILEFKNTNFTYNNTNAFNDFSMEIMEGDIATLVGTSGSGKTTLLKMICHQLPNSSVYYCERKIDSYNIQDLQRNIVVAFDTPITESSCLQELQKYLLKLGIDKEEIDYRTDEIINFFSLENFINKEINKLSNEETYTIKIMRCLILKPRFMAIDNILDCIGAEKKEKFFQYIKKNKMTLLNVTTNLDDALFGNKLFVLENFVLILEGPTLSVLKTDTLLKKLGFRLPLAVDLSIELNHYEVLKRIYTENEKLVNALWK